MRRTAMIAIIGCVFMMEIPAHAEPSGQGGFCDLQPALCAEMGDHDDPQPADVVYRPRALGRYVWRQADMIGAPSCTRADGRQRFFWLVDRETNQVIDKSYRCPDPTIRGAAADLPSSLPSPERVWDQAPLPSPEVRTNPPGDGLTGLATWLWYDQPTTAAVTVQLDGYNVTLNARAVRYHWSLGDGTDVTATTPGTAQMPASTHVYEGKGDYTITLEVTWTGTYTFSGPRTDPITVDLGERTFTGQGPYHVVEIRGVRQ